MINLLFSSVSGPLRTGTIVVSGNDKCRYWPQEGKNNVESELNSVISSLSKSNRNSHADVVTPPTLSVHKDQIGVVAFLK
ncbi:hypothetical protein JTE90_018782 [Oedothorax gibbosus]|uniref:Uncharacterized protein n=1 Tax=Oedothorax gibbosus TaxID=931172 RepID=A0AAV6UBN8_9ARAC|nr:hypothetical protein JTE90_018782 [Oedothorax gibbosus]